jgi:hypothetical protein
MNHLYSKNNPYHTGNTYYNKYVTVYILLDIIKNNPHDKYLYGHLETGKFTFAECELIIKHARALIWEIQNSQ